MGYLEEGERTGTKRRRIALVILLAIPVLLVAAFLWATETPGRSYDDAPATPVDAQLAPRLHAHVRVLAAAPRNLQRVASVTQAMGYIQSELEAQGYSVERQEVLPPADNLIVRIAAREADAPILVVGAHYDSFGAAPGADDNASGVAALLELARALRPLDGEAALELQLVFYANEEPPYFKTNAMGSLVHARSFDDPARVAGMISLETMGYYSGTPGSQNYPFPLSLRYPDTGNFVAFVGELPSRSFLRETIGTFRDHARIPSVGGTAPGFVQGIDWSDHWAYAEQDIPAIMVTDTAPFRNPHYHRASDTPDTLDYLRLALAVEGLRATLAAKAGGVAPPPRVRMRDAAP